MATKTKTLPTATRPAIHMSPLGRVALAQLRDSPFNPRTIYDEAKLRELAEAIESCPPIVVRVLDRDLAPSVYEIVYGHRRKRAAALAGLDAVEALLVDVDDDTARDMQYRENAARADLTPLEEASFFAGWVRGGDFQAVADRIGKPVAFVRRRAKLDLLSEEAKHALRDGQITLGVAELLAGIPGAEDRAKALEFALEERYDGTRPKAAAVEKWIEDKLSRELSRAPWDLDDESVAMNGAPACMACPKRTGAQAEMFPGSKNDRCLDQVCWTEKLEAWTRDREAAGDLERVADGYGPRRDQDAPPGRWGWVEVKPASEADRERLLADPEALRYAKECALEFAKDGKEPTEEEIRRALEENVKEELDAEYTPSCPSAKAALISSGARKGEVVRACTDRKCKVHRSEFGPEPKQQTKGAEGHDKARARYEAERQKREATEARERAGRRALFAAVMAKMKLADGLGRAELELVAARMSGTLHHHGHELMRELHGWKGTAKIPDLSDAELLRVIVELALVDEAAVGWGEAKLLTAQAKRLKVDAAAVKKAAAAAAAQPKTEGDVAAPAVEKHGRKKKAKASKPRPKAKASKPRPKAKRKTPAKKHTRKR